MKAFKYRIYPNKTQEKLLVRYLDLTRELYNAALQERIAAYQWAKREFERSGRDALSVPAKERPKGVTQFEQSRSLTEALQAPELAEFKQVYNQVLRDVLARLDKSYQSFFRGGGFPKFKGRDRWNSFCFPQIWSNGDWRGPGKLSGEGAWRKLQFPLEGRGNRTHIRLRYHRPLEGTPKTLSIKREGAAWYAVYTCEGGGALPLPKTGAAVGIDMGVNPNFFTCSDGRVVEAPRFLRKDARKLAQAQRSLSKKKLGSNRRRKARKKVADIHARIARKRADFHWKTAAELVRNYDLIVHEDLAVKNMARAVKGSVEEPARNRRSKAGLNKSILDAGWGSFLNKLHQQAKKAGKQVLAVEPMYTSRDCAQCGARNEREIGKLYTCSECGNITDGDLNAAKNILKKGLTHLGDSGRKRTIERSGGKKKPGSARINN